MKAPTIGFCVRRYAPPQSRNDWGRSDVLEQNQVALRPQKTDATGTT